MLNGPGPNAYLHSLSLPLPTEPQKMVDALADIDMSESWIEVERLPGSGWQLSVHRYSARPALNPVEMGVLTGELVEAWA